MAVIMRQGGLMILCAALSLVTGQLYARYAARFSNGFAAELRTAEYAAVQRFDFKPTLTASQMHRLSHVGDHRCDRYAPNAVNSGLRPLVRNPVMLFYGAGHGLPAQPAADGGFSLSQRADSGGRAGVDCHAGRPAVRAAAGGGGPT